MNNQFLTPLGQIKTILLKNQLNQFILIDSHGNFVHQKIEQPQLLAGLLVSITNRASIIGKNTFKSFTISRKNNKEIAIFPVGKYYLGVVLSNHAENNSSTESDVYHQVKIKINNIFRTMIP